MTDAAPNPATMTAAEAILHSMNMGNDAGMRFLSDWLVARG